MQLYDGATKLTDAVMGWLNGDINQRGVLCFGLREKEFEEEEGSELESQGKKKGPN